VARQSRRSCVRPDLQRGAEFQYPQNRWGVVLDLGPPGLQAVCLRRQVAQRPNADDRANAQAYGTGQDPHCHEGTEPPFGGPATDVMTRIGIQSGDTLNLQWAYLRDTTPTGPIIGSAGKVAPPPREPIYTRTKGE
jgi:hypothetical protein